MVTLRITALRYAAQAKQFSMEIKTLKNSLHLTYCLNIHPAETWADTWQSIAENVEKIKARIAPSKAFGIGLRLSAQAAEELEQGDILKSFKRYLEEKNLYVFTVNGFPYGKFHAENIKSAVYSPDWSTDARLNYTKRLARILAALLPAGVEGSISTLPGTYRQWLTNANKETQYDRLVSNLVRAVLYCHKIKEEYNREITLALEPEPDCVWERVEDILHLFREDFPRVLNAALEYSDFDVSRKRIEGILYEHLGVCYDTCHQMLLFENPFAGLTKLKEAAIRVPKIQLSNLPKCQISEEGIETIKPFAEDNYLHQTAIKDVNGRITRFPDLHEALKTITVPEYKSAELRTHFHIPLHQGQYGKLQSCRDELTENFFNLLKTGISPHLEIETYTFSVIPQKYRPPDIINSIIDELSWAQARLSRTSG